MKTRQGEEHFIKQSMKLSHYACMKQEQDALKRNIQRLTIKELQGPKQTTAGRDVSANLF